MNFVGQRGGVWILRADDDPFMIRVQPMQSDEVLTIMSNDGPLLLDRECKRRFIRDRLIGLACIK